MKKIRILVERLLLALAIVGASHSFTLADAVSQYREVKKLSLQKEFSTSENWWVAAYQDIHADYKRKLPAKLCFWHEQLRQECFLAETSKYAKYQLVDALSIIEIQKTKTRSGILFTAKLIDVGLGKKSYTDVWVYNKSAGKFERAVSGVGTTDQGQLRILSSEDKDIDGLLVVADRIWDQSSESISDPHFFDISIYKFQNNLRYKFFGKFRTLNKYQAPDEASPTTVIDFELPAIRKFIAQR